MTSLIYFFNAYLYESSFSALLAIKTKQRNRLDPKDGMSVALSKNTHTISISH